MSFGFLNVNKPSGMTAHDVVSFLRKTFAIKQIGHGGTLDPMATGVLPVAVGKACRLLRYLDGTKAYLAEILLGTSTTTDDLQGEVTARSDKFPGESEIRLSVQSLVGVLSQVPPLYSAVHHEGKRLYELARQGVAPEKINPRTVTVHEFEILEVVPPVVKARITCSAGTYIRSLARDLGEMLSCGGCLKSLMREKAGPFSLAGALTLEDLEDRKAQGRLSESLIAPASIMGLACLPLDYARVKLLTQGQTLALTASDLAPLQQASAGSVLLGTNQDAILVMYEGELIAVCRKTAENRLRPEVVIAHAD